jgi:hypothetical protein
MEALWSRTSALRTGYDRTSFENKDRIITAYGTRVSTHPAASEEDDNYCQNKLREQGLDNYCIRNAGVHPSTAKKDEDKHGTITASEEDDKDWTITARTYGIYALGFSVGEADEQTPLARSLLMAEVTASPTVSRGQIIWPGLARNRTTFRTRVRCYQTLLRVISG